MTGQMVGDRRFSEATILGGEFFYRFRQPSSVGPANWSRASRRMYNMAGPVRSDGFSSLGAMCLYGAAASLSPAVAAAAVLWVSTLRRP